MNASTHRFAKFAQSIALPILTVLCSAISTAAQDRTRPNIVILYADDMGYGDLGIQNPDSKIPTPNLDKLASQGIRFTDAHSSSGICTPSRYALLHGRYHWRKFHGIVQSFDQPILDAERLTIAELLKSKGYQTACIGKWHLGWDWQSIIREGAKPFDRAYAPDAFDWSKPISGGPLSHGFDTYFGDDVPNFPPYAWFENDRVVTPPTTLLTTTAKTAEGSWEARPGPAVEGWDFWQVMPKLTDRAEAWLADRDPSQPFFLYFPFTSPHAPIVPTDDFVGQSQAGGFGDFMVQTDETVGRVMHALESNGLADNTLIIFTSDNGPERYAYDRINNFAHRSMGQLRGLKRDIWEGGHRVPMIASWPGVIPAGEVNSGLISQIDLIATIAALTKSEIPAGSAEDSLDQSQLLLGGSSARDTLVHNTNTNGYAIRHQEWVLIDAPTGAVSKVPDWFNIQNGYVKNTNSGELYNLSEDIAQKHNVYSSEPVRVESMKQLLEAIKR